MAAQKDENGQTPFQLACCKVKKHLTTTDKPLPESLSRFLLFLHSECKSNPNEPVNCKQPEDEVADEDDQPPLFYPIFKLISDRCVDLIDRLVKQSKSIDFNVYSSEGLTPLLKSIESGEFKFAEKLIDLGLFDDTNLLKTQICKNTRTHMRESVIQLLIRSSQASLLTKTLHLMFVNVKNLIELLEHKNSHGQNFLHTLSFCSNTNIFNSSFLSTLFKDLNLMLTQNRHPDCLPGLLKARDVLGRNPAHFCLLTSGIGSSRPNKDLELFFVEDVFGIVDAALSPEIFTAADSFGRLPIHYVFYNTFNHSTDLGNFGC